MDWAIPCHPAKIVTFETKDKFVFTGNAKVSDLKAYCATKFDIEPADQQLTVKSVMEGNLMELVDDDKPLYDYGIRPENFPDLELGEKNREQIQEHMAKFGMYWVQCLTLKDDYIKHIQAVSKAVNAHDFSSEGRSIK